jgi:hypothetical protein
MYVSNNYIYHRNRYHLFLGIKNLLVLSLLTTNIFGQQNVVPYLLKNSKYIYINKTTKQVINNTEYDYINIIDTSEFTIAYQASGFGKYVTHSSVLKNSKGEDIFASQYKPESSSINITASLRPMNYNSATYYHFLRLNSDGKVVAGFINKDGSLKIDQNANIDFFKLVAEDRLTAYYGYPSYSYALVDTNGVPITSNTIKKFGNNFSSNLIPYYYQDDKCGYMDKNGNEVIFAKYKQCEEFSMGIARVTNIQSLQYDYINKRGEKINLDSYIKESIKTKDYQLFIIDSSNVINNSKTSLIFVFYQIGNNESKLAVFNDKLKLFSTTLISDNRYSNNFYHRFKILKIGTSFLLIKNEHSENIFILDYKQKRVIHEFKLTEFNGIGERSFPFKSINGWGYKNYNSQIVIEPKYYMAKPFKYGYALVKDIRGWHLINESDKKILSLDMKYSESNLEIVAPGLLKCILEKNVYNSNAYLPEKYFLIGFDGFEFIEK